MDITAFPRFASCPRKPQRYSIHVTPVLQHACFWYRFRTRQVAQPVFPSSPRLSENWGVVCSIAEGGLAAVTQKGGISCSRPRLCPGDEASFETFGLRRRTWRGMPTFPWRGRAFLSLVTNLDSSACSPTCTRQRSVIFSAGPGMNACPTAPPLCLEPVAGRQE